MELILIRHGTTQGNLEKRFIGTLDVPLLPQGEELARRVGPTLPRWSTSTAAPCGGASGRRSCCGRGCP